LRRRATRKLSELWENLRQIPEKTKMIIVFAGLFVLSVLVTIMILSSGRSGAAGQVPVSAIEQIVDEFSVPGPEDSGARPRAGTASGAEDLLSVQDLILPMPLQGYGAGPYFLRPKLDRWGDEQVNRYWIPLEELALDLVREENDRRIEMLFEEIP
jgi:hypothetical protein